MTHIKANEEYNKLNPLLDDVCGLKKSSTVSDIKMFVKQMRDALLEKLNIKCLYCQILTATKTDVLERFLQNGGWDVINVWLKAAMQSCDEDNQKNFLLEMLKLLQHLPMNLQRLEENDTPKVLKRWFKNKMKSSAGNDSVHAFEDVMIQKAQLIITNWKDIVIQIVELNKKKSSENKKLKRKCDNSSKESENSSKKAKTSSSNAEFKAASVKTETLSTSLRARIKFLIENQLLNIDTDVDLSVFLNPSKEKKQNEKYTIKTTKVKESKFRMDYSFLNITPKKKTNVKSNGSSSNGIRINSTMANHTKSEDGGSISAVSTSLSMNNKSQANKRNGDATFSNVSNLTNGQVPPSPVASIASHVDKPMDLFYEMPDLDVLSDDSNTTSSTDDKITSKKAVQVALTELEKKASRADGTLKSVLKKFNVSSSLKKKISWKDEQKVGNLVEERIFEYIEGERINVNHYKKEANNQSNCTAQNRNGMIVDKLEPSPKIAWKSIPIIVDKSKKAKAFVSGSKSEERHLQAKRQKTTPAQTYFQSQVPDFPDEPEKEYYSHRESVKMIPLGGDLYEVINQNPFTSFKIGQKQVPQKTVQPKAFDKKGYSKKKKYQICRYWKKGNCHFGERCKFLHSDYNDKST